MIKVSKQEDVKPIQMSIYKAPAYCYNVEEEERDDHPWYHNILRYKRRKDQVLLRCVDVVEAKKILEEVHEGVFGTHVNGFTMARQIMIFGYYWSTIEGNCINYAKRCHKCQIYGDKIHVPHLPLHISFLINSIFVHDIDHFQAFCIEVMINGLIILSQKEFCILLWKLLNNTRT
ncbi:RNA-directed DNA polymerase [Gossypium australe]|uniref:RNA-directed DNA polymerase n=1 Tax=Gossypium australe TaxID=47621 RepID=A0A5B6VKD8_9ROSI|nr:RNA-directed DNA polymerase [Gossypium australe]